MINLNDVFYNSNIILKLNASMILFNDAVLFNVIKILEHLKFPNSFN